MRWYWMWAIAVLLIGAAYLRFGWQGALFVFSLAAFVAVMQFSRTLRVLATAGRSPIGHVASGVMLNAKLREGMLLTDVLRMTRSLGEPLVRADPSAGPSAFESFRWRDPGGITVDVELVGGRVRAWSMQRPEVARAADQAA